MACFASRAIDVKFFAARDGARLVGLAAMVRNGAGARDPGCWSILADDYSDFQLFPTWGGSQAVTGLLLDALETRLPSGETVVFRDVPQYSALGNALAHRASKRGSGLVERGATICPMLFLSPEFVRNVNGKTSVRRHERSLARLGKISVEHLTCEADIAAQLPTLFSQHVNRWSTTPHPSLFNDLINREFYQQLVNRLAPAGDLLFTLVRIGSDVVAQHFGLRSGKSLLWYKPTFDTRYQEHSPGEVLLSHLVRHAATQGFDNFDFTRGGESFKFRFSSDVTYVRNYDWHRAAGQKAVSRLRASAKQTWSLLKVRRIEPVRRLGARASQGPERALVLGSSTHEGETITATLSRLGIVVDKDTSLLSETRSHFDLAGDLRSAEKDLALRYALIVPATDSALAALLSMPDSSVLRQRSLLPPTEALERLNSSTPPSEISSAHTPSSQEERSDWQLACLYANGRLVMSYAMTADGHLVESRLVDPRLLQAAKNILDDLKWHGLGRVCLRPTNPGRDWAATAFKEMDGFRAALMKQRTLMETMWRIARGEAWSIAR